MTEPAAQSKSRSQVARPELVRWRSLDAFQALCVLADYVKEDISFKPTHSPSTRRVHATAAGADWELLVDGPKFYDTRAQTGGGGAIDLAIHLWRVPFKKAALMLRQAGV